VIFFKPTFQQVAGEYKDQIDAALAKDEMFGQFESILDNPDMCQVAELSVQLYEQLNAESQTLIQTNLV